MSPSQRIGKVLLLARSFPPPDGGVERRYANLCRFFPAESIEVFTSLRPEQAGFDAGEPYPIHRVPVRPLREKNPLGFASWTGRVLRRLGRGDVGVIWLGDLRPLGRMGWALRRLTGTPYGISFYGWDLTSALHRPPPAGWKRRLARRVLDDASFLLANSRHIGGLAEAYAERVGAARAGDRLHVVRSGADLERFHPDRDPRAARAELGLPDGTLILTAARLIPQKGVGNALRAFATVALEHPEARYVMAGAGPRERELRRLARELGIAERVVFLGHVPYERVPLLHSAADLFLLASRRLPEWTENFPNAVLEAMATGRPVVAGGVGGVPEMVAEGVSGLLVDPEEPAAIAAALRRLLDDPLLARAMGAAGRARAESELSHERAAREVYRVLERASRLPLPAWTHPARRAAEGRIATALV